VRLASLTDFCRGLNRVPEVVWSSPSAFCPPINPLALTKEQCIEYDLPSMPIKETERRANKFIERHGRAGTVSLRGQSCMAQCAHSAVSFRLIV
jgi:hypothetical protein